MRLLLVDDHILVRDALKTHIERVLPGAEVLTAISVPEALEVLEKEPHLDLAILDLFMPGMDGLQGLKMVKERLPDIPVVIMSGAAAPDDIERAMSAGASGFLPKTLSGKSLDSALNLVAKGEVFVPPSSLGFQTAGASHASTGVGRMIPTRALDVSLTKREQEVLSFLAQGMSNKEIARELNLQEVTVKLHVRGACKKLDAKNRTQAALKAKDLGIVA